METNIWYLTAQALVNLKEDPPNLTVHGSIMTERHDDEVTISPVKPSEINPKTLELNLKIIEGNGGVRPSPKHFVYTKDTKLTEKYNRVVIYYPKDSSIELKVEIYG